MGELRAIKKTREGEKGSLTMNTEPLESYPKREIYILC